MSLDRAIIITIPTDWSEASGGLLFDRLTRSELPEGIHVTLSYWDSDEQCYSHEREVTT